MLAGKWMGRTMNPEVLRSRTYFAHSSGLEDTGRWHPLSEHLRDTGDRAALFLDRFGWAEIARTAGLLHDLGKYTPEFQRRLHGDPSSVDHSTARAKISFERYGSRLGKLLACCF
jgi:CRISPR-associated endonuclease/helicase Cas3